LFDEFINFCGKNRVDEQRGYLGKTEVAQADGLSVADNAGGVAGIINTVRVNNQLETLSRSRLVL